MNSPFSVTQFLNRFFNIFQVSLREEWIRYLCDLKRDPIFAKNGFYKEIDGGGGIQTDVRTEAVKACLVFSYPDRIRRRIRLLWLTVAVMLLYMVVVGETGGDSRRMTELAGVSSRLIFFGGLAFIGCRIAHNKRLLKNRLLLQEQLREELDERNQYLHDKSGGIVVDVLLCLLLFLTMTAALYETAAFYALSTVLLAAALKAGVYAWYKYGGRAG